MTRVLGVLLLVGMCASTTLGALQVDSRPAYLNWTADEAKRIGRSMRVNGRVGGAFDFRVVHTERSYNYKLRSTWLTTRVIQATTRLLQLTERLTDARATELLNEAVAAGDLVMMVEIDPREGSGVIPIDWSAFLGPAGSERDVVPGTNTPSLGKLKALRGVYPRDYNYDSFWIVFPAKRGSGPVFIEAGRPVTLTVRISGKEGQVQFTAPETYTR